MTYTNYGTVDFDRLNRETRTWSATNVDRFNYSTQSNYTYSHGNPSNPYLYCSNKKTGHYLGNGQYVED